MFHWAQYLKDDSLMFLDINEYLDLSKIRLKVPSSSSQSGLDNDRISSDADDSLICGPRTSNNLELDDRAIQDLAPNTNVLKLLRDYNEEIQKKVFNNKNFECKVCFIEKAGSNCIQFWPCNHVYCKDCMKSYFEIQIKEGNIKFLRCPYEKCESEANPKQVSYICIMHI